MTFSIGNDIVEIQRIESAIRRYQTRFLNRVFTSKEQAYCLSKKKASLHFAARFAAKEAVVKAFGIGFTKGLSWLDIEIINDNAGKPLVYLSPFARKLFPHRLIHLSMSHTDSMASAVALIETQVAPYPI